MASSVSSERAFSSAGITISKRRNRLKSDVVEALQFLKCLMLKDVLFREDPTVSAELELDDSSDVEPERDMEEGWDELVGEDGEEAGSDMFGDDDDDVFLVEIN